MSQQHFVKFVNVVTFFDVFNMICDMKNIYVKIIDVFTLWLYIMLSYLKDFYGITSDSGKSGFLTEGRKS